MNSNLPTSSHSVEINPSVLMFFCLKNLPPSPNSVEIRPRPLTRFNNKNRWNTFMCSSFTLPINPSTSANYPPKKWNTPVPLFPQKSPHFPIHKPKYP